MPIKSFSRIGQNRFSSFFVFFVSRVEKNIQGRQNRNNKINGLVHKMDGIIGILCESNGRKPQGYNRPC